MDVKSTHLFKTPHEMVKDLSLHKTLLQNGFAIQSNFFYQNKVLYVKAITESCIPVMIQIDEDYFSTDTEDDIQITDASNEEHSKLVDFALPFIECVGYEVCGVAFECDGVMCTLEKNSNGKDDHINVFKLASQIPDSGSEDHKTPYVIVKLSDIKNNPKILDYIDRVNRRVRNSLVNQSRKAYAKIVSMYDDTLSKLEELTFKSDTVFRNIKKSIEELEEKNSNFGRVTIHNFEKKSEIQQSLKKMNERVILYSHHISKITQIEKNIEELRDSIIKSTKEISDI